MRSRLGALVNSRSSSGWLIDFTGLWRTYSDSMPLFGNNVENSIDLDYGVLPLTCVVCAMIFLRQDEVNEEVSSYWGIRK